MALINRIISWLFRELSTPEPTAAYHTGYNDSMNGKAHNPFAIGTQEAADWQAGWNAAEDWKLNQW